MVSMNVYSRVVVICSHAGRGGVFDALCFSGNRCRFRGDRHVIVADDTEFYAIADDGHIDDLLRDILLFPNACPPGFASCDCLCDVVGNGGVFDHLHRILCLRATLAMAGDVGNGIYCNWRDFGERIFHCSLELKPHLP